MIWRLVVRRVASLRDLEETWSILDAQIANEAQDVVEEAAQPPEAKP